MGTTAHVVRTGLLGLKSFHSTCMYNLARPRGVIGSSGKSKHTRILLWPAYKARMPALGRFGAEEAVSSEQWELEHRPGLWSTFR